MNSPVTLKVFIFVKQVKDVKNIAKRYSVSHKGTRLDVIMRLQKLFKQKSIFRKEFNKLWGKSGEH